MVSGELTQRLVEYLQQREAEVDDLPPDEKEHLAPALAKLKRLTQSGSYSAEAASAALRDIVRYEQEHAVSNGRSYELPRTDKPAVKAEEELAAAPAQADVPEGFEPTVTSPRRERDRRRHVRGRDATATAPEAAEEPQPEEPPAVEADTADTLKEERMKLERLVNEYREQLDYFLDSAPTRGETVQQEPTYIDQLDHFLDDAPTRGESVRAPSAEQVSPMPQPEAQEEKEKDDGPIVMLNTILSRQAGLKAKQLHAPTPEHLAHAKRMERKEGHKRAARRGRMGGLLGAGLAAFLGLQHHGESPREVTQPEAPAATRSHESAATAPARSATEAPATVTVPHKSVEVSIDTRGEGAIRLYQKLAVQLDKEYPDRAHAPALVQKLLSYKSPVEFVNEFGFMKLPKSAVMHEANSFKYDPEKGTLVYVDRNKDAHVLVETKQGKLVSHPVEVPMRDYTKRETQQDTRAAAPTISTPYNMRSSSVAHSFTPAAPVEPPERSGGLTIEQMNGQTAQPPASEEVTPQGLTIEEMNASRGSGA